MGTSRPCDLGTNGTPEASPAVTSATGGSCKAGGVGGEQQKPWEHALQPLGAGLGLERSPDAQDAQGSPGTAEWAAGPGQGLGNAVTSFINPLPTAPPTTVQ